MNASAVTLEHVTVAHRGAQALSDVSGSFLRGSLTAVHGPNGAGKSTLLAAIIGHMLPAAGTITLADGLRQRLAFLPQLADIDRTFPIRVLDVLMLGHWGRTGGFGSTNASQRRAASEVLQQVGLTGCEQRLIGELSSGQWQRVLFARVVLFDARLILLDEPFAGIDRETTMDLLATIRRWREEQRTVIAVLHEREQIRSHFPMTLLLCRRQIAWGNTRDVLTADNLARAEDVAARWTPHGVHDAREHTA